jgi:hypothetical protein
VPIGIRGARQAPTDLDLLVANDGCVKSITALKTTGLRRTTSTYEELANLDSSLFSISNISANE